MICKAMSCIVDRTAVFESDRNFRRLGIEIVRYNAVAGIRVVGVVDQFRIPVKFVGIGEGIDDLKVFDRKEFVSSLFSKDDIV